MRVYDSLCAFMYLRPTLTRRIFIHECMRTGFFTLGSDGQRGLVAGRVALVQGRWLAAPARGLFEAGEKLTCYRCMGAGGHLIFGGPYLYVSVIISSI